MPTRPAAYLRLRAFGLEGLARAKQGQSEAGLEIVRGALAVALEHDLTTVAADLYQRLSVALYDAADFRRAEEALDTALDLCRAAGEREAALERLAGALPVPHPIGQANQWEAPRRPAE